MRTCSSPAFPPSCSPFPWLLAALVLAGCSSSDSSSGDSNSSAIPGGAADGASGSADFHTSDASLGRSDSLGLASVAYGRLVDVLASEPDGREVLVRRDVVIDPRAVSSASFTLDEDPVTGRDRLHLHHAASSSAFAGALEGLEASLVPLAGRGADDMLPRDAALVLTFDDLLDPATIGPDTVRLEVGELALEPYVARVLTDPNHVHEVDGVPASRRVIIDLAVDAEEARELGIAARPGLPAASSALHANVLLRLPSACDPAAGQTRVLTNLAGARLVRGAPIDGHSASRDHVLSLRAGGATAHTGDANQGLLADLAPPRIVGTSLVSVLAPPMSLPSGGPKDFVLPSVEFLAIACAQAPGRGDILRQPGFEAVVSRAGSAPQNGIVTGMVVRLVQGDPLQWPGVAVGSGQYLSPYDPSQDEESCFVTVLPLPTGFPGQPSEGLSSGSTFTIAFNEAIDPQSMVVYDALALTRQAQPDQGSDYVVGDLAPGIDLTRWSFVPALPLAHRQGSSESYFVHVTSGPFAPRDLAGNPLARPLRAAEFHVDAAQADQANGGRVLRFRTLDDEPPFAGGGQSNVEVQGQHVFDASAEVLRPRPVVRFDAVADPRQPIVSAMTAFPPGVQTPLVGLGAKLQAVWRYADVGFDLDDSAGYNLDVEGLNWAPASGQVLADSFPGFEIRLAHGAKLPDEYIDPLTLLPRHPDSGLERVYEDNVLEGTEQEVVHPRPLGYALNPADLFTASTGTPMMPYPLNENLAPGQSPALYTWRDTDILSRGGEGGNGAPLDRESQVAGMRPPAEKRYPAGEVPSVGLPLLLEFRAYPDAGIVGLNQLSVALAANTSARPYFRAFSAGGISTSGTVLVDPDLETQANGGFDQGSNPPGQPTPGQDNAFFIGSLDLVVRVSRSVTVWFPATGEQGGLFASPTYEVAQSVAQLPAGTAIELDFRGASSVVGVPLADASQLDLYGDYYVSAFDQTADEANPGVAFGPGAASWSADLGALDGLPYHQVRITFVSNAQTLERPSLAALGLAWSE